MGYGCGMSCWRRLRDWQEEGVSAQRHQVLLERLHAARQIDRSRASLGSASVPAKKGGCHRPEPDGPGQGGHEAPPLHRWARHTARLLPERGHRHDSVMMASTLDAISPLRGSRRGRPRWGSIRFTLTRPAVPSLDAKNAGRAGLCRASPAKASRETSGLAATAGSSSRLTLDSIASVACPSVTSGAATSTLPSAWPRPHHT